MPRARRQKRPAFGFQRRLEEIYQFLSGTGEIHRTVRRLVVRLERAGVPYAILGGVAVNAHGHRQTTDDVDVLLAPDGLAQFQERVAPGNYELKSGRRWRFIDRANGTPVDIALAGSSPGWLRPSPLVYPDPTDATEVIDNVVYVPLKRLIELKLAIGRYRDLGDVTALIAAHALDGTFVQHLDPSTHGAYLMCLEQRRREDEYEARNG